MENEAKLSVDKQSAESKSQNFVKVNFMKKGRPSYSKVVIPRDLQPHEVEEIERFIRNIFQAKIPDFIIIRELHKELGKLKAYVDELEFEKENLLKEYENKEKEIVKKMKEFLNNPEKQREFRNSQLEGKIADLRKSSHEKDVKINELTKLRDKLIYENHVLKNSK